MATVGFIAHSILLNSGLATFEDPSGAAERRTCDCLVGMRGPERMFYFSRKIGTMRAGSQNI
jgi:hypothetical protein